MIRLQHIVVVYNNLLVTVVTLVTQKIDVFCQQRLS